MTEFIHILFPNITKYYVNIGFSGMWDIIYSQSYQIFFTIFFFSYHLKTIWAVQKQLSHGSTSFKFGTPIGLVINNSLTKNFRIFSHTYWINHWWRGLTNVCRYCPFIKCGPFWRTFKSESNLQNSDQPLILSRYHIAWKFGGDNVWRKWMDKGFGEKAWQMNRSAKWYLLVIYCW